MFNNMFNSDNNNSILLILGLLITVIGSVNLMGEITTIHSYNRKKVKEEDVPKYGKAVGTGSIIIGISFIIAFIATFWNATLVPYIITPAIVVGLGFILYAQFKYNKRIF